MSLIKRAKVASGLFLFIYCPIQYSKNLTIFYSYIITLGCFLEFFYQIILREKFLHNQILFLMLSFFWIIIPGIYLPNLNINQINDIIILTVSSDIIQLFSFKIYEKLFQKKKSILNSFLTKKPFIDLSPKKTIIGYLGGLIFCQLFVFITQFVFYEINILYFSGCLGDLFASLFKRRHYISDYSKLLSAHGGLLDRFDSLFFNIIMFYFLTFYH